MSSFRGGRAFRKILVYDFRFDNKGDTKIVLETGGWDFNDFVAALDEKCNICSRGRFVLTTTDRKVLDFDRFQELKDDSTIYLLQHVNQTLSSSTKEQIDFSPHFDTLIQCGTYEYYASEGKKPIPYALAELVDNALSATAKNEGVRTIEIRMMFDETLGKPAVIVLDNGCGMSSKKLRNWAVYRLSKFKRQNGTFASEQEEYVRPDPVPHSINSDISYFGVGGKQAVFYMGDCTRMISKPIGCPDVHELVLSKKRFEEKEKNKKEIYKEHILNRKPGDSSHVSNDERFLHALITEERGKESFTAVVITGIYPAHIKFLKERESFKEWTRQLAHVFHYYLHGVNGNDMRGNSTNSDHLSKIDIQITLQEKPPKCPRVMNLREVADDMQTLYIKATADTFEFKAFTPNHATVEGVIRYHPFLYHKETYPEDPASPNGGDDNESEVQHQAREKRKIFECFWNGRLIPYTKISEFDWCSHKAGRKEGFPVECYSRLSGVLFADDGFQITTNKLTFTDLELKLKDKGTAFTCTVNGQRSRNIEREFRLWLKNCHERLDKQVKFLGYQETITRADLTTKKMQAPWAVFRSVEIGDKVYKTGQLVKSQKTQSILYGVVVRFLLFGEYRGNVFATGGEVEIALEPKALYDTTRFIPISKIDKAATDETIRKHIDEDAAKLPDKLKVDWPDGDPWAQDAVRPAGTPLGSLKIEILNKKGESISRMPKESRSKVIQLSVKLRIVRHGPKQKKVFRCVAQHSARWGFWFKKMENLTKPGKYTLSLNAMINDSNDTMFGGRELPSYTLNFTITAGYAESFVADSEISTRVGVPFNIPLQIKDHYGNPASPSTSLCPVLECTDLDLTHDEPMSSGATLTIINVRAKGKTLNYQPSKTYDLKVTLSGLRKHTETIKISLLPGNPHSLHVMPDDPVTTENGTPVKFNLEVHDEAGNITANPGQTVHCQIEDLLQAESDCSTGAGQLVTEPINVKIIEGEPQKFKATFQMPNHKDIAVVEKELKVTPSARVSRMELYSPHHGFLVLKNNEETLWLAGGLLENLFYRLYDEAGWDVPLTEEIASKIKVNWTGDVNLEHLVLGKLPDIQVPTRVQEKHFYQVSYQDQSVSFSFTIVPRPDEPARLKATLPPSTVKLGETLSKSIELELVDRYDNVTNALTPACVNHMTVEADGLDKSAISLTWQESSSSVTVTGVCFEGGTPGSREMRFTYRDYMECVMVKVTAGDPAKLKLVGEPQPVLNGHGIPTPFVVQLLDKWGNPSQDQRVVVKLCSLPALKVTANVSSQLVNAEGKACFTVQSMSGTKGCYQLDFKSSFNNKPIDGVSVNLTVIPDPKKPVSLSVEYDTKVKFPAGGRFPVFSVTVVSDEGSPITTFNPTAVSMWLWEGVSEETPPQTATELKCNSPMENDRRDCFYFRDKDIPEHVGKYTIQFSLRFNSTRLLSNQIPVNVVANQPVKLGPDSQPSPPVVSYSTDISNRTLVNNLTLRIKDFYGNPAGQDLDGNVVASIKSCSGDANNNLPLFDECPKKRSKRNRRSYTSRDSDGGVSRHDFKLVKGKVHIPSLVIMENSPGEDGSEYTLVFKPEVSVFPTPLSPFELTFLFNSDAKNHQKISELSRKKNELTAAITEYKNHFTEHNELLNLLTEKHQAESNKEVLSRSEMNCKNIKIRQPLSVPEVNRLLTEKTSEVDEIQRMPRRVCSIRDNFRDLQDVLGMVGHLAYVQDNDAARVISWHISGDMDCVITKTLEAAMRIYNDSQRMQQVMPFPSVHVNPDRPLPHIRNGCPLFDPPGNPVYARELLTYPHNQEICKTVFKNILGDTILMDDLVSANSYRAKLVQNRIFCPTILTRQGDRVSSKGKFGGRQNIAPPIAALKVFGAPLPDHYNALKEQIDLLHEYQSILQKMNEAKKEREDHIKLMNSPEEQAKKQDMEQKKMELETIERQLESTPNRPMKRGPEGPGEPSGIITKRAKQRST